MKKLDGKIADEHGFMQWRIASINDLPIHQSDSPKETLRERKYY